MEQGSSVNQEVIKNFIVSYIKKHLKEYVRSELESLLVMREKELKEVSLLERVIRVEEELKALREIELARFETSERRFEALEKANQQRFETIERRFEALQREMDKRFEALEKRFNFIQWFMGIGFSFLGLFLTILIFVSKS